MTARDELVNALARRYAVAGRAEKTRILDEFVAIAGFHRKHAMRRLRCDASARRSEGKASRRIYDEAVREAIVVLWEASDRICGKRLKALMPVLVEAMERHGHLRLGAEIRAAVLAMSASTIDRSLREVREQASGRKRRRTAAPSSVRKSIPVRTFSDWDDPPPGFVEADLVAHCGPVANGSFVQTLTVTDIATGWTECAPLLYREQTLLREVLGEIRRRLPFELLGFDTDNDSVFVNATVRDYCRDSGIVFTRCRPWRKNDQAFVEQKNGAIVRRIVGYRRLEGLEAAAALSRLYTTTRRFVNFFQPSFKLASKRREGARVSKRYHPPATPCQRLLADPRTPPEVCERVADPAAEADAGAATEPCGHRRQAGCRAVGLDRAAAGAIPCRIAHRVAGRRSKAHGHTGGEAEARPTEARSAGDGDGATTRLVRGRAVVHEPPIARAASVGTSRGVPGRAPAYGAASGEGLAEAESDGDGVRRTGRNANRGVDRGSGDIGSCKTRYPRFERNELGSRKEHFGEATVRELGNIFE